MPSDAFADRGRSYEAGYFASKDADLISRLRSVFEAKRTKDEIRKATGIQNEQVLDRLISLSLSGELMTVFRLYPLVEIAWADGTFDPAEAHAVLEAAVRHGVSRTGQTMKGLEEWLKRGPTEDGRAAWRMYAAELRSVLSADELHKFRDELLRDARSVAESSGGLLGMFFQVTGNEHKVMDAIKKALTK